MPTMTDLNHEEMMNWRHDLHAHPELGFAETRTCTFIQERLHSFGVDEIHNFTGTGVLAIIRGKHNSGKAIGLRADIDALPIPEESGVAYASTNPGIMHACGHDGHTSMLLGAAKYLAASRNFKGTAYLIFQPAEEIGGGRQVVADGLFDRYPMERIFGMHNMPYFPVGEFYWRNGPIMAAANFFEITITGKGAHAAQPQFGIDPIVAGSALVGALQTIVSRSVAPTQPAVVTVGSFQSGVAANVIPQEAVLKGTARWIDAGVGEVIMRNIARITKSITEAHGATAELESHMVAPATINDEASMNLAREAAVQVAGAKAVVEMADPIMGGEDFAYMLDVKPGAYIMLGAQRPGVPNPGLHHPAYDFNDEILAIGARYWTTLVEQQLGF
jgi:hippurate hydrolase